MFRLFIVVVVFCMNSIQSSYGSFVPLEHREHCTAWQNGKCIKGKLSDLAKSMEKSFETSATHQGRSEACDRVCLEGCPNCSNCSLCSFCSWYSEEACVGVPYYKDRETCEVGHTKDCCDLCKVQCKKTDGVCGSKGYCNGGGPETDLMGYCIEHTTDDQCMPCSE